MQSTLEANERPAARPVPTARLHAGETHAGKRPSREVWSLDHASPLPEERVRELINEWRTTGSNDARQKIALSYLRLIAKHAGAYASPRAPREDLISEGLIALCKCIDAFDPERRVSFTAYASVMVRHAVRAAAASNREVIRVPGRDRVFLARRRTIAARFYHENGYHPSPEQLAECTPRTDAPVRSRTLSPIALATGSLTEVGSLEGGSDDVLSKLQLIAAGGPAPSDVAAREDDRLQVVRLLRTLPTITQQALRLRFGIDQQSPMAVRDVARALKLPESTVASVLADGMRRLRVRLRTRGAGAMSSGGMSEF